MRAVVAHDHVALRLDEAAGAFLGFLEFPVAVGELLDALLQLPQLGAQDPRPPDQQPDRPAGGAEQRRGADRERVRVIGLGALAAARNPNAAANDIDSRAAARTTYKSARPPKRRYGFAMMPERTRMSAADPAAGALHNAVPARAACPLC